jgi:DNA-binding MurR/RpiR family transcriptional regulator
MGLPSDCRFALARTNLSFNAASDASFSSRPIPCL